MKVPISTYALMPVAILACNVSCCTTMSPSSNIPANYTAAEHPFDGHWRISPTKLSDVYVEVIESRITGWKWQEASEYNRNEAFSSDGGYSKIESDVVTLNENTLSLGWSGALYYEDWVGDSSETAMDITILAHWAFAGTRESDGSFLGDYEYSDTYYYVTTPDPLTAPTTATSTLTAEMTFLRPL